MAIIPLPPKFAFSSINKWGLSRKTNLLSSKYTGATQSVKFPYAVWELEGDLIDYDGADLRELHAFLTDLDGRANTFRFPVPGYAGPSTGYNPNAVILAYATAANQSSIQISGNVNSPLFNRGDYFTVNDELKEVTAPVATNNVGNAVVSFKPALRVAVPLNTLIILKATCLMRAADDDIAQLALAPPLRGRKSFSAVEAF